MGFHGFRRRRKGFWRKSKRDFGFRKIAPNSKSATCSLLCVYCTKSEPIFKTKANRTRGARGGSKLSRTLHESPPLPRFTRQPQKEKMFLASFDFRGGGFF